MDFLVRLHVQDPTGLHTDLQAKPGLINCRESSKSSDETVVQSTSSGPDYLGQTWLCDLEPSVPSALACKMTIRLALS